MHSHNLDANAPKTVHFSEDISEPLHAQDLQALKELTKAYPGTWTPDLGDQVNDPEQPLKGRIRHLLNACGFGEEIALEGSSDEDFHKAFHAVVNQELIKRVYRLQDIAPNLKPGKVIRVMNAQGKQEAIIECQQYDYIGAELLPVDKGVGHITLAVETDAAGQLKARVTETLLEVRSGELDKDPEGKFTQEQAVETMKQEFERRFGVKPRAVVDIRPVCKFYQPTGQLHEVKRKSYKARVVGRDAKGQGQTPEMLFATDDGEIKRVTAKQLRFGPKGKSGSGDSGENDAVVKTFVETPTRAKPLADQLVDAAIPGVPATSKKLPVIDGVYFYYEDENGEQHPITAGEDGYNAPAGSAAFTAIVNVQHMLEGEKRALEEIGYPALPEIMVVGLNQSAVQDNGYADNQPPEEIDHQKLADMFGLPLEKVKKAWTVQLGRGSGGKDALAPDMDNDLQVGGHEWLGHIEVFKLQPDFPHAPHEGRSDYEATGEGWIRANEHGLFTVPYITSYYLVVGGYAAGDFTGVNGKAHELRDGEAVISANAFSMDPHYKGLTYFGAMGKTARTALSKHLDELVAKFGSIHAAIVYFRKIGFYQIASAPGDRTTFQDLAASGLNKLEKDFASGALRDALIAEYVMRWKEVSVSLKKVSTEKDIDEAIQTSHRAWNVVRRLASETNRLP